MFGVGGCALILFGIFCIFIPLLLLRTIAKITGSESLKKAIDNMPDWLMMVMGFCFLLLYAFLADYTAASRKEKISINSPIVYVHKKVEPSSINQPEKTLPDAKTEIAASQQPPQVSTTDDSQSVQNDAALSSEHRENIIDFHLSTDGTLLKLGRADGKVRGRVDVSFYNWNKDPHYVNRVALLIDEKPLCDTLVAPFKCSWDTKTEKNGLHLVSAEIIVLEPFGRREKTMRNAYAVEVTN